MVVSNGDGQEREEPLIEIAFFEQQERLMTNSKEYRPRAKNSSTSYETGYGKPPVHSRWKKGQSGNPSGRPKRQKSIEETYKELLSEMVEIRVHGTVRKATMLEAIIRSDVVQATKDARVRKAVLERAAKDAINSINRDDARQQLLAMVEKRIAEIDRQQQEEEEEAKAKAEQDKKPKP
jgi:hypothetical protein